MKIIYLIIVAVGLSACHAKKDVASNPKQQNAPVENNSSESCADAENDLTWYTAKQNAKYKSAADEVSNNYKTFLIDNEKLQRVIESNFKNRTTFIINLPFYYNNTLHCMSFEMQDSETINRQTQERISHYTHRGIDITNPNNVISMDFTLKKGLAAYGQVNGKSVLIRQLDIPGNVYISFEKSSSTIEKEKFE